MKISSGVVSPWYRERWPWLLMLGPALVIVAGLVTAWLAFQSSDGLVDDDYYKQGLAVNQRIHRDREAFDRAIVADLVLLPGGRQLSVTVGERLKSPSPPLLVVRLAHPTVAGRDIDLNLPLGPDGTYRAEIQAPLTGRWVVSVEDPGRRWRLVGEWQPGLSPALHLAPRNDFPTNGTPKQGD